MKGSLFTNDENRFMLRFLRFNIVGLINQAPTIIIKVGLICRTHLFIYMIKNVCLINQTPTNI